MAHPDKDSGTEQEDRIMQNFVKISSCVNIISGEISENRLRDLSLGSHCTLVYSLA